MNNPSLKDVVEAFRAKQTEDIIADQAKADAFKEKQEEQKIERFKLVEAMYRELDNAVGYIKGYHSLFVTQPSGDPEWVLVGDNVQLEHWRFHAGVYMSEGKWKFYSQERNCGAFTSNSVTEVLLNMAERLGKLKARVNFQR